jgi:hypothetical protein
LSEHLHIVCLDAPAPPNYGGAIDMFYKVKALAASGRKIILHYFAYRKGRDAGGLEAYCQQIHHYSRTSFFRGNLGLPYIMRSRMNENLIRRLNEDEHPILLEGLHTTGLIASVKDQKRIVVRMHNEEAEYYRRLARTETNVLKRRYLHHESNSIRKYYDRLNKNLALACLSLADIESLQKKYGFTNAHFIPAFVPWQKVLCKEGKGPYCLYHGNMAVAENDAAALWLITEVFSKINVPFIVAGNGISAALFRKAQKHSHIQLVQAPSMEVVRELVQEAHINVLPSMNNTGVKLKLLHAAFEGRFCLSNSNGIKGSSIESGIIQCNNAEEYTQKIGELFKRSFTHEDKKNRQQLLAVYDNSENARRLNALWKHYQ